MDQLFISFDESSQIAHNLDVVIPHAMLGIKRGKEFVILFYGHVFFLASRLFRLVEIACLRFFRSVHFLFLLLLITLIFFAILFVDSLLFGSQIIEVLNLLRCSCEEIP